jgi:hypothetical protein
MTGGAEAHATGTPESSAELDHGDDEEIETNEVTPEPAESHDDQRPVIDQRIARPEPIEQAFGAEAHPAERTASDPAAAPAAPPAPRGDTSDDPQ